jgi:hypothetical protein
MGAPEDGWLNWWPGWDHDGRRVEILLDGGRVVKGELIATDFGFDGEKEYPIFSVIEAIEPDDSIWYSFAGARKWRFCE